MLHSTMVIWFYIRCNQRIFCDAQIPIYRCKYTSFLPYAFTQTERFIAKTYYFLEICLSASIFQSQTLIYQCNPLLILFQEVCLN